MSAYKRLAHSKKGMSSIFGGLFFVIILLMGFNVMVWGFAQYDSYNHVITTMSQRDQQAISENIVPVNPGCVAPCSSFDMLVNNLGGISVSIASIYIQNVSPTGSAQCSTAPCVANPAPSAPYSFTAGNIPAGVINYKIHVQGMTINDGSGYKIALASTRGRLFTFYYPWPVTNPTGGGGGLFVTNIGPLSIYFDFKSFNYTSGTQTSSQSAFCMPAATGVILYVKIANTATDSDVKLLTQTGLQAQAYGVNGFGQFSHAWIEDNRTINPSATFAYDYVNSPYDLAPSSANGPTSASFAIVKFGASGPGGTGAASFGNSNVSWITFIGFYYLYRGQPQGQTIPFMDFVTSSPNCVS